jgi:large subunit ribosomal protein L10
LAISREKKEQMVAEYLDNMSRSRAMILADYRGLTVANITQLRQNLREVDGSFHVVKNTLFERALQEAGMPVPTEQMDGPLAIGFCYGDTPPVAKALVDFARGVDVLEIKGAILGTDIIDAAGVRGLAELPPRDVLRAQLIAAIEGPMSNLVNVLNAPMREIAQVLKARSEQDQEAAA